MNGSSIAIFKLFLALLLHTRNIATEQFLFGQSPWCLCHPVPVQTGTLTRDFKHLAVDMYKTQEDIQPEDEEGEVTKGPLKLRVDCHFGKRKRLAAIRTCTSHVQVSRHGAPCNGVKAAFVGVYVALVAKPRRCSFFASTTLCQTRQTLMESCSSE